jgi:polyhydroxyalkanoate synthesis repressor PhaR
MTTDDTPDALPGSPRRVIKRYSNRKLYDTRGSTYVTLLQIAEMIRAGEDVQIIDNTTKEDKTDVTLALIISEELRTKPRAVPLSTLKALIRHGGERILSQLRGGPMGKLLPGDDPAPAGSESEIPENPLPIDEDDVSQNKENRPGFRATLEHWQATIDERIRATLPNFSAFRSLEQEVRRLNERLDALEKRLEKGGEAPGGQNGGPPKGGVAGE